MKIIRVFERTDTQEKCESSPDLTPSQPFKLVMMSPPGSSEIDKHVVEEEDGEFHTPPEHHSHSHVSYSEDQNPIEALIALAGGGADRAKKARVSEAASDNEPEARRVWVVAEEEFDGDTVPLGETEVVEIEEDGGVQDADINVLDSADSNGKEGTSLEKDKVGERSNKSRVGESEKVVEIPKDANTSKDSHGSQGVRVEKKRVGEFEEFRYEGYVNERRPRCGSCKIRQLPPSLNGKKDSLIEASEKKGGLLDENVMAKLEAYFGGIRSCLENVDIIETAKKRGMKIPRPRSWLPEDEN